MRTSKPQAGNKFYTTKAKGGYSTCIEGSPTDTCNVLANCVGYACGRFNEIIGEMRYPNFNCNAEKFVAVAEQYGLQVAPYPTLGGIMVWGQGTLAANDGAGHVEIVEQLLDNNEIHTSGSNYKGTAFYVAKRNNNNGQWGIGGNFQFRGCIVNPAIGDVHYEPPKVEEPVIPFAGVSDEELARRVWTGEFGSGETRRNALGSRWAAVQSLVDRGVGKDEPAPAPENRPEEITLHEGVAVEITGYGNTTSNGNGARSGGIGYRRVIQKVYDGRPFPYQVGNEFGTTGFYKAEALRRI